jgi:pimeloyl-ACP methyl ester carboxylesterase
VLPWLPPGRTVVVPGRGEFFVRQHVHPDPARPTLLLLHGWTASSDLQFFTAYEAMAAEYSFVGVDHRGHGRGLRGPTPFVLEDVADDAAAVVRTLGVGPVVTIGYSMGGPISLLLAHRHPDLVRGIVVQATALEWRASLTERLSWQWLPVLGSVLRSRMYPRYLRKAIRRILDPSHALDAYEPWILGEISRGDPHALVSAGRALSTYDARPWASGLRVPAAMLVTTRDRLVKPRKQRALAGALGAAVREMDADHLCTMAQPAEYASVTMALLADVTGAPWQAGQPEPAPPGIAASA